MSGGLFRPDDQQLPSTTTRHKEEHNMDDDEDVLLFLPLFNTASVCDALSNASSYAHKCLALPSTVRLRDVYVQARADRAWPTSHTRPAGNSANRTHTEVQLGA